LALYVHLSKDKNKADAFHGAKNLSQTDIGFSSVGGWGGGGEFSQDKEINSVGGGVNLLSRGKLISPDRGILFFIEGRKFEIFQSAMKFH
jgi:hypothetical protein